MEMRMDEEDYKTMMSTDNVELKAKTKGGEIVEVSEIIVSAKPEKSKGGGMFG